jgi:hypothetical protein
MRVFTASLALTFVLSMLTANGAASQRVLTGTVTQFRPGHTISVMNASTDPCGVQIALRNTAFYDDRGNDARLSLATIDTGARVTVWYRSVGERRPIADKVRVLADDATR